MTGGTNALKLPHIKDALEALVTFVLILTLGLERKAQGKNPPKPLVNNCKTAHLGHVKTAMKGALPYALVLLIAGELH